MGREERQLLRGGQDDPIPLLHPEPSQPGGTSPSPPVELREGVGAIAIDQGGSSASLGERRAQLVEEVAAHIPPIPVRGADHRCAPEFLDKTPPHLRPVDRARDAGEASRGEAASPADHITVTRGRHSLPSRSRPGRRPGRRHRLAGDHGRSRMGGAAFRCGAQDGSRVMINDLNGHPTPILDHGKPMAELIACTGQPSPRKVGDSASRGLPMIAFCLAVLMLSDAPASPEGRGVGYRWVKVTDEATFAPEGRGRGADVPGPDVADRRLEPGGQGPFPAGPAAMTCGARPTGPAGPRSGPTPSSTAPSTRRPTGRAGTRPVTPSSGTRCGSSAVTSIRAITNPTSGIPRMARPGRWSTGDARSPGGRGRCITPWCSAIGSGSWAARRCPVSRRHRRPSTGMSGTRPTASAGSAWPPRSPTGLPVG